MSRRGPLAEERELIAVYEAAFAAYGAAADRVMLAQMACRFTSANAEDRPLPDHIEAALLRERDQAVIALGVAFEAQEHANEAWHRCMEQANGGGRRLWEPLF
jgi:hypothetical protein